MKRLKKLSCLLLATLVAALCLFAFPTKANAATSGYYTYEVSNGKATITDCATYVSGDITIPSSLGGYPVTGIGDRAFEYCTRLTGVTIPDSVTSIGDYAFDFGVNLTYVNIGNGVTSIGVAAFSGGINLTNVTIGNSVTSIGDYTFSSCQELTSVTMGNSVTSIGNYAFSGCYKLTNVTLPDSLISIGTFAFSGCDSLTSMTIPDSVTSVGQLAFASCEGLSSVTIGNSVTSIDYGVFEACDGLTSVTIGNSVASIGQAAFSNCTRLTSVTIPKSVTDIAFSAFDRCDNLKEVYYTGSQTQWYHIVVGPWNAPLESVTIYYNAFPDVKSNAWYFRAVNFAVENGYFSGNGDGTFAPGKNITRQDFVVVLSRIAGANLTQYSGQTNFADVPSNAYYAKAIHWATENGIISGYNATKFGVGDSLTREQLVTILSRYAQKLGVNVAPTATAQDKMNTYADAGKINPHMKNAVAWALQNKVISGMTETTIAPQGNATRAQVANILMNINAYKVIPGI